MASPTKEGSKLATEEALLNEINNVRGKFNLPKLESDSLLRNYSLELLKNKRIKQIPVYNDTVYMSCFYFLFNFRKWTAEKYVKTWLDTPNFRTVLFSPGNRGATCMFSDPETKENYVAVYVASAYSP